jgi:predicted GIY-YIG superfamily endonuclease
VLGRALLCGSTDDLERRVAQHESGAIMSCYTLKRRPVHLVWSESFPDRLQAKEAERRLKGWSRAKKEGLIAGDWERGFRLGLQSAGLSG